MWNLETLIPDDPLYPLQEKDLQQEMSTFL